MVSPITCVKCKEEREGHFLDWRKALQDTGQVKGHAVDVDCIEWRHVKSRASGAVEMLLPVAIIEHTMGNYPNLTSNFLDSILANHCRKGAKFYKTRLVANALSVNPYLLVHTEGMRKIAICDLSKVLSPEQAQWHHVTSDELETIILGMMPRGDHYKLA